MTIDIGRIRNVGFVGHGGVGKTSLVEAILFRNGMTSRLGRVDDGTATTDFDPEEIKRKISINIGGRALRLPRPPVQLRGHAGVRRLHRRGPRGPPRRRGRGAGRGRRGRRRGADGEGVEVRPGVRTAPAGVRQPDGPRARRLRPDPRVDPAAAQGTLRAAPRAHRPGDRVPGAGGRAPDEGLRAGRRTGEDRGDRHPGATSRKRCRRAARSSSRPWPRPTTTCSPGTSRREPWARPRSSRRSGRPSGTGNWCR